MKQKIRNAPSWLGLTDARTEFVYLPDRAEIVKRIFQYSIDGLGAYTIAKLLNAEGVPAFGWSKRWDQSTIHNMLNNKATLGEYQRKQVLEGKEVPIGEPIPNYYPPVIDKKTFEEAQATRRENLSTRRGRKGRRVTNLFSEIPRCSYCGSRVKLHNAPVKSLVCKRVWDGEICFRFKWSYRDFEETFLTFLQKNDETGRFKSKLEQLRDHVGQNDENGIYQARLAIVQHIRSTVVKLTIAFGGTTPQHEKIHRTIRRDHPNRYFTVELSNGTSYIGHPITPAKAASVLKVNSEGLCEQLGLSPRQGKLTALLAEGESLAFIAKELGMTLSTARWHLREIFRKTNAHSQGELINLARTTFPFTNE
ncbi:recombinase family protein [Bradyrhizobium roseum]|uniref:recombinase family protein n=1 Tax=Bradyrhizobium roseum TaxID=3056648 RepID=UPI00260B4EB4|nr:recombinase family protein [Bradyrhizobium roseus]WKA26413.1 recombinase family protein [Bradyrhizobium roseus]